MTGGVFLDSGIFIAFMNRRDRYHTQAAALFGAGKPQWRTSLLVISETYSWFLHRMGEEMARTFRLMADNLDGLEVLEATQSLHAETVRLLDRFRGLKLTYVDAASLVLLSRHQIEVVWSTDRHLGLTGAEILPSSPAC